MVFLDVRREDTGSSRVVMGTSGNLSCFLREVSPPFNLRGAPRDSSPVASGE